MTPPPLLHGFGARYDLPLSLSLYIVGAAGVVLVSFVLIALFAAERVGLEAAAYPRRGLTSIHELPGLAWLRRSMRLFGVVFLLAVIVTGGWGSTSPDKNPAEYLTWVYFWAGLVVLSGVLGPIWEAVNPFLALDGLLRWLRRAPDRPDDQADRLQPAGIWPAVVLFFSFASLELTSGYANRPWLLAWVAAGYTIFTVAGMQVFGAPSWLARVEFFGILFALVSRLSPLQVDDGHLWLRPPGAGLLDPSPAAADEPGRTGTRGWGWDRIVFVILMLSTLAFDGLIATPLWQTVMIDIQPWADPLGAWARPGLWTLALAALSALFLLVFTLCMRLVVTFADTSVNWVATSTAFALTLVPIAWAYNLAHNYSYLVIQSQGLIVALADPLDRGWHLLPTAGYRPSFALAQASTVWYVQVVLIVTGHITAVVLAHLRAGERFESSTRVLLSQYPMLMLMILYTMTSLWILAQPITSGG